MKYTRPQKRNVETVPFPKGKHLAKIVAAKFDLSKDKNRRMITLRLIGQLNEVAYYNLLFGTTLTEDQLGFLLASIEDNGVTIPELDYGYNEDTITFLKGKKVFIDVVEQKYKGKIQGKINRFLTKSEFDGQDLTVDDDPFQNEAETTDVDAELNF